MSFSTFRRVSRIDWTNAAHEKKSREKRHRGIEVVDTLQKKFNH